ncbi:MAG: VanZ family protein [Deltaproteobacteria bacterium]|nr:VanZ family protein [Deltaproteobacteria bacterium]
MSISIVLWFTLIPQSSVRSTNLIPFSQSARAFRALIRSPQPLDHPALPFLVVQVIGNVAAFVPIGFGAAGLFWLKKRWRTLGRALLLGCFLSVFIELAQLLIPTRATDIDDVIFNTAGAGLGALVLLFLFRKTGRAGTVV